MKTCALVLVLGLIAGCTYVPPSANGDIETYCQAVANEAADYAYAKKNGARIEDLRYHIGANLAKHYPAREVRKMVDVAEMVYAGKTPEQIKAVCVAERVAGTWFKGDA